MRKLISIVLCITTFLGLSTFCFAENECYSEAENENGFYSNANLDLPDNILGVYLCEAKTGRVLYASNEFKAASPASVTKIMTLILVCEALDSGRFRLSDTVRISARAASMGGSQVFLEEGERITVEELIKSAVIASGNDASVALAELTAGSETAFVRMMNEKAEELSLKNTSFENCTGLDDTTTNHFSCAADIGVMSRELIKHSIILQYSSIWQDTIRNGEFTLTNTNRLVRFYEGCNGLKTGSTDKAGYCVSVTAKRGNMQLIAVVMGAESRDDRNNAARAMLDYGFANFALYEKGEEFIENAKIIGGVSDNTSLYRSPFVCVVNKSSLQKIEEKYEIPEDINAPIEAYKSIGRVVYLYNGIQLGYSEVYSKDNVKKIELYEIFIRIMHRILCG